MSTADYVFELDGGRPCLDFANTLSSDGEHLNTYADLVAFVEQSNLITREDAEALRADAASEPEAAEGVLRRARSLRSAIYAMFSALATDNPAPERDLDRLNFELAATLTHARVFADESSGAYRWGWSGRNLDAPLWPVSRSAADLLTSDQDRSLIRECGADDCHWLFLDTSKNKSRQWCSMRSCGNREKARRFYQRTRRRTAEAVASTPKAGSAS